MREGRKEGNREGGEGRGRTRKGEWVYGMRLFVRDAILVTYDI